jgi:hypothetical protein
MIDDDLRQLNEGALDHSLDGLESDIWAGLAARSGNRAAARQRASFQSVVMVLALIGSIAVGINATRPAGPARDRVVLALGMELTPSSLLLGSAR